MKLSEHRSVNLSTACEETGWYWCSRNK